MKTLKFLVLATILAAAPACKKKKPDATPTPVGSNTGSSGSGSDTMAGSGSATMAGSGSDMAGSGSGSGSAVVADATAEYITIEATHKEKKPEDPVKVSFEKFKVTKASFDPKKVEGGKATIEVDVTSLTTGSPKRDGHLKTADYLDAAKFATLVIDIDNVKKKDGSTYTADAKVKLHGVEKTYPVTFEVTGTTDDSITIRGEHKFSRLDFKVGKAEDDKDESTAAELTAKLQLTLKKT